MSTYVMSDIHGEYEKFMTLLDKINFSPNDILYVLGDIIDRGPHPIKILQEMMKHKNIKPILGNHEFMAVNCLPFLEKKHEDKIDERVVREMLNWKMNGNETTIKEYHKLSKKEQKEIINYLQEFYVFVELCVNDCCYILVHAGLGNFSPEKELSDYWLKDILWTRPDYSKKYFENKYVITGHTPTYKIKENPRPGYIFRANNHIAIDCGACFGKRLGAICLETGEEFYSN